MQKRWGAVMVWGDVVHAKESWRETEEVNSTRKNEAGENVGVEGPGGRPYIPQ